MNCFAIIGLGQFGKCMLMCLTQRRLDVLVIDHEESKVQWARDIATKVVKADALNLKLFEELLPEKLHCAIVDLGHEIQRSILATNYLHKLKVPNIVVEAVDQEHAEILQIVGATRIVFPEQEAAERLTGLLAGHGALDYFPVGEAFSLVEIPVPQAWIASTLPELDLRKKKGVNVVAIRPQAVTTSTEKWTLTDPERKFESGDVVLIAGGVENIEHVTP